MFPGYRETTLSEGRSRFCGQEIRKAESVEAVCELYRAEWARFENAAEEKRRAKEEEVHRVSVLFWDWLGCYLFVFTVEDGGTGSTSTRGWRREEATRGSGEESKRGRKESKRGRKESRRREEGA
jgi:hypothetical protein